MVERAPIRKRFWKVNTSLSFPNFHVTWTQSDVVSAQQRMLKMNSSSVLLSQLLAGILVASEIQTLPFFIIHPVTKDLRPAGSRRYRVSLSNCFTRNSWLSRSLSVSTVQNSLHSLQGFHPIRGDWVRHGSTYRASFRNERCFRYGGAFDSAKNHKRQRRKRQSETASPKPPNEKSRKRQSSYRLG